MQQPEGMVVEGSVPPNERDGLGPVADMILRGPLPAEQIL
jgi:hypothetical protein